MKVKDFIEILKMSAIRGLAVGSSEKNIEFREKQMMTWINRSLVKIYSDLNLSQGYMALKVVPGKIDYELPNDYMNVLSVQTEDGEDLYINDEKEPLSVFTPSPFQIQVPEYFVNQTLYVICLKAPDYITDKESELPIGRQYIEALIFYISYIANELIHGVPNWEHQSYLKKYNDEIMRLKVNGLVNNISITNTKLKDQGYV